MGRSRGRSRQDYFIIGLVVLVITVGVMIYAGSSQGLLEYTGLVSGIVAGTILFRFLPANGWITLIGVGVFLVGLFILEGSGIGWFGGFIAGSNFGVGLKVKKPLSKAEKKAWMVDDIGFDTAEEARKATLAALHGLDGKQHYRLDVDHGEAHFQVVGSIHDGLICHRNPTAGDERLYAVLKNPVKTMDEYKDVPLGDITGNMPQAIIHDVQTVEVALEDFFTNPNVAPSRDNWLDGSVAEGTMLTF